MSKRIRLAMHIKKRGCRGPVKFSNEAEYGVYAKNGKCAAEVLIEKARAAGLEVVPEVNKDRMVELNISKARSLKELNERLAEDEKALFRIAKDEGIEIRREALLEGAEKDRIIYYRSVAFSRSFAEGLKRVASFQIVVGFADSESALKFYNHLRIAQPLLTEMLSASPEMPNEEWYRRACAYMNINYSANHSRLILPSQSSRLEIIYPYMARYLPPSLVQGPFLYSPEHYYEELREVSETVKLFLEDKLMDTVWEEYKAHQKWEILHPHQVYWLVRPRPDHADEDCAMSVEVRIADMLPSLQRLQKANELIVGLAYYFSFLHEGPAIKDKKLLIKSAKEGLEYMQG